MSVLASVDPGIRVCVRVLLWKGARKGNGEYDEGGSPQPSGSTDGAFRDRKRKDLYICQFRNSECGCIRFGLLTFLRSTGVCIGQGGSMNAYLKESERESERKRRKPELRFVGPDIARRRYPLWKKRDEAVSDLQERRRNRTAYEGHS